MYYNWKIMQKDELIDPENLPQSKEELEVHMQLN